MSKSSKSNVSASKKGLVIARAKGFPACTVFENEGPSGRKYRSLQISVANGPEWSNFTVFASEFREFKGIVSDVCKAYEGLSRLSNDTLNKTFALPFKVTVTENGLILERLSTITGETFKLSLNRSEVQYTQQCLTLLEQFVITSHTAELATI